MFQPSGAAKIVKHLFCPSSLSTAIRLLPTGIDKRCQHLAVILSLRLAEPSANFPWKKLHYQLRQVLILRPHLAQKPKIWYDVNRNSLTPCNTLFKGFLGPNELITVNSVLLYDVSANIQCQWQSSFSISAHYKNHLLFLKAPIIFCHTANKNTVI